MGEDTGTIGGIACPCGRLLYDFKLVFFPMVWGSRCRSCGSVVTCGITIEPAKPKKPPPPRAWFDYPNPFF